MSLSSYDLKELAQILAKAYVQAAEIKAEAAVTCANIQAGKL